MLFSLSLSWYPPSTKSEVESLEDFEDVLMSYAAELLYITVSSSVFSFNSSRNQNKFINRISTLSVHEKFYWGHKHQISGTPGARIITLHELLKCYVLNCYTLWLFSNLAIFDAYKRGPKQELCNTYLGGINVKYFLPDRRFSIVLLLLLLYLYCPEKFWNMLQ